MKQRRGTIRFISDPETNEQLASIVVYDFGTMNFKWHDPDRRLLANLGQGLKVTGTRISSLVFRCVIENESNVLHDVELDMI